MTCGRETGPALRRAVVARYPGATAIDSPRGGIGAALRALRPYQWVKNLLIFVPLLASGDFRAAELWRTSILIFLAFCTTASAGYLINDMADLAADRVHARKARRPFASGALAIADGLAMLPILATIGAALGWVSGAAHALMVYVILSLAYNFKLKRMPLIDVFVLTTLYAVRLFAGGEASGHLVSFWLLGFSSFLFLSLALIKRVAELFRAQGKDRSGPAGREYFTQDLMVLQMMGCCASFASAIVLALYVQSETASQAYAHPAVPWGVIPLILFWQCRLWLSTARGYMHDDPIVYAVGDWGLLARFPMRDGCDTRRLRADWGLAESAIARDSPIRTTRGEMPNPIETVGSSPLLDRALQPRVCADKAHRFHHPIIRGLSAKCRAKGMARAAVSLCHR